MNRLYIILISILCVVSSGVFTADASTRKERQLVSKGNKLYTERKFVEAASVYMEALKENPSSASAKYNLGLSQLRQVTNPADTTPKNRQLLENARKSFSEVAARAKDRPGIAAKANYNLGNLEFNTKEYAKAIEYYKQALRIDPNDNNARKNLRIAQKQLQQQNQDKNKNQNQDQNKDQKDQNKDQDQNKDKQQPQDKKQEQQPKEQKINQQTAERILQAMDNKESMTRARVNKASKGEKAGAAGRAVKRW